MTDEPPAAFIDHWFDEHEDWERDDPAGHDLSTVRCIRDEIDARVQRPIGELITD